MNVSQEVCLVMKLHHSRSGFESLPISKFFPVKF